MQTHRDIIESWPSLAEFAADIGVSENTAKQMRTRDSINGRYWADVVNRALERGIPCVTFDVLANALRRTEAAE